MLAADTLSILTMEIVDNLVMAVIPGAMAGGVVNPVFWVSMMIALAVAFVAAYPVNRYLLGRGKGHALTHEYHHGSEKPTGARRFIPAFGTDALVAAITAFMIGGLVVSIAAELEDSGAGVHAQAAGLTVADRGAARGAAGNARRPADAPAGGN